jgi:hypothetical protein
MKGRPILLVLCLFAPLAACAGGGVHSGSGGSGGATGAGTGGASVDLHPDEDGAPADDRATDAAADGGVLPRFSFFVTSLEAMQLLSGSQAGFGGDLRDGEASGLAGADKICSAIAEMSMPGAPRPGGRFSAPSTVRCTPSIASATALGTTAWGDWWR